MFEHAWEVPISADALRVLRRFGGFGGVFLLIRPGAPRRGAQRSPTLVSAVRDAVRVANGAVPPSTMMGGFTAGTPRGVAVLVHWNGGAQDTSTTWLDTFAGALAAAGIRGRIGAAPSRWSAGEEPLRRLERTFPAAFVGYRLESHRPLTEPFLPWQVDEATTRLIAERQAAWLAGATSGQTWAVASSVIQIGEDDAADFLAGTALLVQDLHVVMRLADDMSTLLVAAWNQLGQSVTQTVQPDAHWRDALEDQVGRLVTYPEATDVGLIKNAGAGANGWDLTDFEWRGYHHRTVRLPLDYERNRHLWDEYVIDAAGVQLLTGKHLSHAHDLSDWTIEEVAPDRFLVSAKRLDPWYAGIVAEPDTIARARRDFGDMILTWDTILAKPGPYTVTDPLIVGR